MNYGTFGTHYLPINIETQLATTNPLFTEITFDSYDSDGKITAYTERSGITTHIQYFSDAGKVNLVNSKIVLGEGLTQTTLYDYFPLIGVKSVEQPNGLKTTYDYDGFLRLMSIKDNNGNLVKSYSYNYKGQNQ